MRRLTRPLLVAGLLAALLPPAAQAGRAQVGIGMSTWATTDLDGATASGQSWRDGTLLQTASDAAAPPAKDWATVSQRVDGVARSTAARAEVQAQAQLRSSGQPFSGDGMVAADVGAGTLALQWRSSLAQEAGTPREGFARGHAFAELWESFEVVYPITRAAPVRVTLSLQLSGLLDGNSGRAVDLAGVEAYLQLAGVDTGENHFALDPVWRSEASVAGTELRFAGPLLSNGCSVARGVCSGFVSVYAALDLRGRTPGAAADAWQTARAPLDLSFAGQLALQVDDGVRLVRGEVLDALPDVAWAQVSSVPEPGTALVMLAGLAGLAGLALPRRRARWWRVPGTVALVLAAGLPGLAQAGTWQLTATARSQAISSLPLPGEAQVDPQSLDFLNRRGAAALQRLDTHADTAHGSATGLFLGRIGLLKAYAAADYARCCIDGRTVLMGYGDAAVQGRFYDEVLVGGAGLAPGTPVSYQLQLRVSGTVSSPSFESGGFLSAVALAEARLRDISSGQAVDFSWDAARQATGVYTLTLATAVGHTLSIQGMLYAGASVSAGALTARSAEVDFYHSAGYSLAPSVAGLTTIGASGTDFLAPVPEPATAAAMLLGLVLLAGLSRVRRSGPRAS